MPEPFAINRCHLIVAMDPKLHRLEATADLTIRPERSRKAKPTRRLRLQLNRELGIDVVTTRGASVPFRRIRDTSKSAEKMPTTASVDDQPRPALYELTLPEAPVGGLDLTVRYGGVLFQDVEAGEKQGEIHNFAMRAHIDTQGVYLSPDGNWYPRIPGEDGEGDRTREIALCDFELTVTNVPGLVFVASGNRQGAKLGVERGATTTWKSPFPFDGLTLVGGPHEIHQRQVGQVLVSVHLRDKHARFADGLLDAIESYLTLYQPLLGDYPYDEFTVVENFFSSGFAFPGYTVLASEVIAMGKLGMRPGYLDHEMLHNWWGNGVFVSGLDGNWCECLTSYCANYMRPVLEGKEKKARNQRRDICYGLSRLSMDKDKPLGRFKRKGGPSGFVGYQKGSMVFAMLARKIGIDTMWDALRRLYRERLGRPTDWDEIQRILEAQSGLSLDAYFKTGVRGAGVPDLRVEDAEYDPRARRLTITTSQQGDRVFDVDLPVRLIFPDEQIDEIIRVNRASQPHLIPCARIPLAIEVDPDFQIMRKVPLDHVMPTLSGIGASRPLVIVRAEDDCTPVDEDDHATYDSAIGAVQRRYKDADESSVREIGAAEFTMDDVSEGHALVLGKACLTPAARQLLVDTPLSVEDGAFLVGDTRYDAPGHAVLCCIRNPSEPGGVICFYYGNSKAALKKAA
ncbi:MAG: M1 family metallopeptidase [Phycisphaerae bacterium]